MAKKKDDTFDDIFGGDLPVDDMEDVYTLDLDYITNESNTIATSIISSILRLYNNKDFVEDHPDFKKRIDTEIESLKRMYKMAKTNEEIHDHLAQSIAKNPGNASLYMALTKVQDKIIQLDENIKKIMDGLNKICSNYQMELNFEATKKESGEEAVHDDSGLVTRGNKQFIDIMNAETDDWFQSDLLDLNYIGNKN